MNDGDSANAGPKTTTFLKRRSFSSLKAGISFACVVRRCDVQRESATEMQCAPDTPEQVRGCARDGAFLLQNRCSLADRLELRAAAG